MTESEREKICRHLLHITGLRLAANAPRREHWDMERHVLVVLQNLGGLLGPPGNDRINPKNFVEDMIDVAASALAAAQSEFVMAYGGLPPETEEKSGVQESPAAASVPEAGAVRAPG